jgi:hypothetical protein
LWSCNHTGKFPRNHRFVLGERIERNLYDLLELLIRAKYTRQRQPLPEKANLVLEILPTYVAAFARTRVGQPAFWRTRLHAEYTPAFWRTRLREEWEVRP